jgi:hypothetical protein
MALCARRRSGARQLPSVNECGVQRFKWFFSAASPELLDLSSLSDESRHRSDEDVLKDTGAEMSLGSELGQSSSTYKKIYVDNHRHHHHHHHRHPLPA